MFKLNKFFKINNLNREAGKVILIKFGVLNASKLLIILGVNW